MASKVRLWNLAWALLCAPALIYVAGRLERTATHPPRSLWLLISCIVLPGLALGSGVLAAASLVRSRAAVRLAVVGAYSVLLYALTLAFDNVPLYATHAIVVPMP